MPYATQPTTVQLVEDPFVSDGSYARFVKIDDVWHISLAPSLAALVRVGTTVTCDVETKTGRRHTRSGTVIRKRELRDGTARALCSIEEYRAGRASDERNTFALLPDGSWGIRLHASASRHTREGDLVDVAVTSKSGRVSHVTARVLQILQNEHGDRQAIGEIVSRDNQREPEFKASHGVSEPCPTCGTTACDAGIVGRCTLTPEAEPYREPRNSFADTPLADVQRAEDDHRDTGLDSYAGALDWDHWSGRIDRDEPIWALLGWKTRRR